MSASLQPLCFKSLGGKRRKTALCTLTLSLFAGRGKHCTFARLPGHGLILGRAPSAGRGRRWWMPEQTLLPDPLQHHQLPHGQQLLMASGSRWEKPSVEHGSPSCAPCPARLHSPSGKARSSHTTCSHAEPALSVPVRMGQCTSSHRATACGKGQLTMVL